MAWLRRIKDAIGAAFFVLLVVLDALLDAFSEWGEGVALRWNVWLSAVRRRQPRRRRVRQPLRSTRRDAKRAAHEYACDLTQRDLSWKAARKLLKNLEHEGRSKGLIAERAD